MYDDKIDLMSISKLVDNHFFIPDYQRGYRWTSQQVKELLEDINEFRQKLVDGYDNGFIASDREAKIYCIQPLVVKKQFEDNSCVIENIHRLDDIAKIEAVLAHANVRWEVIDGQQRLTTIHIILSYLTPSEVKYSIEYDTREVVNRRQQIGSKDFLNNISVYSENETITNSNIDFFHMGVTFHTIKKWFEDNAVDKDSFLHILKERVKFIWYETEESNPITVFTRLNVSKISLTDSELIKALFLNRTNFISKDEELIRLQQIEIAAEWDKIEFTLQDNEFWLFIHDIGYTNPTRIDFIFDIIRMHDIFNLGESVDIGTDEHKTFRYFYTYFKSRRNDNVDWLRNTWLKIKNYFLIFEEWFNDLEMYHYVGFLIECGLDIQVLVKEYNEQKDKTKFLSCVIERIKKEINRCNDLTAVYDIEKEDGGKYPQKAIVRPLLILHNIQTIIDQNKELVKTDKYQKAAFYRFPFHLFKWEAHKNDRYGWEIEHIASNAGDLEDDKNKKLYLYSVKYLFEKDGRENSILLEINKFLSNDGENINFKGLKEKIQSRLSDEDNWCEEDKNRIWNYTLLDSSTNQEYHNSIFLFKRMCVMSKERGRKTICTIKGDCINVDEIVGISFVPQCTKNVFTKSYTRIPQGLSSWTYEDAYNYVLNINDVLSGARFVENQKSKIDKIYKNAISRNEKKYE